MHSKGKLISRDLCKEHFNRKQSQIALKNKYILTNNLSNNILCKLDNSPAWLFRLLLWKSTKYLDSSTILNIVLEGNRHYLISILIYLRIYIFIYYRASSLILHISNKTIMLKKLNRSTDNVLLCVEVLIHCFIVFITIESA